jgi:tetratricopeptide (TPR) repeat protein
MTGIAGGSGVAPRAAAPAPAAPPPLDSQQREMVTLESKRLGQRVHGLFGAGRYNEALDVAEQQMRLLKESYGEGHHEYATAMNNVATLLQAIGRYTEAEPLLQEASKVQQRTLGDDHPHTVASLSNLATVYQAMGETERAEAMQVLVKMHKATWEQKQQRGGAQRRR